MADVSRITGYSINSAYSNFGGQAGGSTTTGVGGVGAYHHHHRGRTNKTSNAAENQATPDNSTSDLLDLLKASNDSRQTRGQFFDKFA